MNKVKIKRFFYIALIALLFPIFITSCEFEMSDNGDLDGFWQMTEKQIIGEEAVDMRNTGTIWGFQFRLAELRSNTSSNNILCRFENKNGHLRIYEPRLQRHDESDSLITDTERLIPLGVYKTDEDFKIETLTSSNMILVSDNVRLKFRKY